MRVDFGFILAMFLEYIFFIYYADTLFYRKRSKVFCYSVIGIAYFLHYAVCAFGNPLINVITFIIINILSFILCYHINIKATLFHSVVLVFMSAVCEILIAFIPSLGITPDSTLTINQVQSLLLTIASKTLYLICIIVIGRLFYSEKKNYGIQPLVLITIPALSIVAFMFLIYLDTVSPLLSVVCVLLVVINLIILGVNKKLIKKDIEIADLKEQTNKDNLLLEEYTLLKDKYEKTRIFRHDFKEHLAAVRSLVGNDNTRAKEYIDSICCEASEAQLVSYSDNSMLNILLNKKREICKENNINFIIEPIQASMKFLSDMDTISLFSNLINNAVESYMNSTERKIFLDINTVNENFVVIKFENSADKMPIVIDGVLRTNKGNKNLHGIGLSSIRRALKKYDGVLKWSSDEESRYFSTIAMIQLSNVPDKIKID